MNFLTQSNLTAYASGKAILIGEHSVVYGHKAVAIALPDVKLKLTFFAPDHSQNISSWDNAWFTKIRGNSFIPEQRVTQLLTKAFEKALTLCGVDSSLQYYIPQKFLIESDIPLGGGMGGSAAISTCLLKIANQIFNLNNETKAGLNFQQQIQFANEIDCLFHFGKASGLDASTVASNGIIEFSKGKLPEYIQNKKEFWLALVDSKERGETAHMVKKVAEKLNTIPEQMQNALIQLGVLAEKSILALTAGDLKLLANCLNTAQNYLCEMGVSTEKIDTIIQKFKDTGALAAKLTGAGGGGMVLGLFESKPDVLYSHFDKDSLFITRVPQYVEKS
ncbi:mevalonate kinase [Fluviispira multicolorata]|uniref:Mevalonate kinase n=1 Tax=Fluviispira multicolorata TaxID=2654512 RepID=A0A833JDD1_9BACT|nr:mevalonate kinase [Fluviispira multicolorata]KAB8031813.1 mevalonate kinase [Fluviispira multicolorata]